MKKPCLSENALDQQQLAHISLVKKVNFLELLELYLL